MGIYATYRRITPDKFAQLQLHPDEAEAFFGWNLDLDNQAVVDSYFDAIEADERYLDVGKSWQTIRFLLTGEAIHSNESNPVPRFYDVFLGGRETRFEAGYGWVRYFTQDEVVEVAKSLNKISTDQLHSRLGSEALASASIHPTKQHWNESELEQLLSTCTKLVSFFNEAAKQGDVVLIAFD